MIEYKYLFQYFGRMKRFVTLSVLILFGFSLFGQTAEIKSEIEMYTKVLKISETQKERLEEIVNRKYQDLETIKTSRSIDESIYRAKRRSIYQGELQSIRLIIKEEQLDLWAKFLKEERLKNAKLIKDLNTKNANKEDLMDAQYGIIDLN